MRRRRSDLLAVAALALLWWLPALAIGVGGESPISDDWAYAQSARTLAEAGRFERPAWTWAPSVTNVVVGAAFSRALGFSHATLRISTLVLGLVGVLAAFGLARRVGLGTVPAALAAALLAANPLYFSLGYTFMTDVGFTALCLLSLLAGVHALRAGSLLGWGLGAAGAVAAILSRQPALMLPAAAGAALLLRHRRDPRVWLGTAAVAGLGLLLYSLLPLLYGGADSGRHMRVLWYLQNSVLSPHAPYHVARSALTVAAVGGLSLLPLLPVLRPSGRALAIGAAGAAALLGVALRLGVGAPWHVNVLRADFGLGPHTLPGPPVPPAAALHVWSALDALGAGIAVALLATLVLRRDRLARRPDLWMLLLFPVLAIGLLAFQHPFFDRWMLPFLVPLAVVLLVQAPPPTAGRSLGAAALLALLLGWSGLGTADTLDHYRARVALLDGLAARGIGPDRIDGGFEFNGHHHFDRHDKDPDRFKLKPGSRWLIDDEFVLTPVAHLPGYEPIAEQAVARRLPPGEDRLYVQRRMAPAPPGGEAAGR